MKLKDVENQEDKDIKKSLREGEQGEKKSRRKKKEDCFADARELEQMKMRSAAWLCQVTREKRSH